ncbi:LOW QUALITY PROTEIN: phosphatidylinositol-glycan biosynthesis class X protein [Phyllobates terribilis]|uniref:LOW QUALITY PROTEIN: phosphatidylinositol-glycan biosynthesis class X protein n=1 Tax=Phyllobates terribilis TaxID=111132 RepID=UPI003CCAD777
MEEFTDPIKSGIRERSPCGTRKWLQETLIDMSKSQETLMFFILISFFCSGISTETFCPKLTVRREILKNGFHRDLVTRVQVPSSAEQMSGCSILLRETLPSGLFLDPYQLSSLRQHNLTEVVLMSLVDLEAPEYLSAESHALVYIGPDQSCAGCFISSVPVHARYHRPSAHVSHVSIVLQRPQMLVHCSKDFLLSGCLDYPLVEAPCEPSGEMPCQWMNLPYTEVTENAALQVPVGRIQHGAAVCIITVVVTLFCTGLILTSVYNHRKVYRSHKDPHDVRSCPNDPPTFPYAGTLGPAERPCLQMRESLRQTTPADSSCPEEYESGIKIQAADAYLPQHHVMGAAGGPYTH